MDLTSHYPIAQKQRIANQTPSHARLAPTTRTLTCWSSCRPPWWWGPFCGRLNSRCIKACSFLTQFAPKCCSGNITIFTIIDRFSKYAHLIPPAKLPSAKETTEVKLDQAFRLPQVMWCIRQGSAIHGKMLESILPDVGSLRLSFIWIPPPKQRADRALESGDGRGAPLPCFLVPAITMGGICLQHLPHLCHWTVTI